jgi:hypothetical protein
MAPVRASARRFDAIQSTQSTTALTLTPMGDFAQVSDSELLLRPGNPAFWEVYPDMNFPRHKGFSQELSHETTAALVPNCWL